MDLELTDEQTWLTESVDTLLAREWLLTDATPERRRRVWEQLVAFGALTIGGEEGLGAVELCLIARSLGAHLVSVPFLASAAVRLALADQDDLGDDAIAIALLEPGSSWTAPEPATTLQPTTGGRLELRGHKVGIEQLEAAGRLAVIATLDGDPALALTACDAPGLTGEPRDCFDPTLPMHAAHFDAVEIPERAVIIGDAVNRLRTVGALLAAAESIGAAGALLGEATRYAGERRQFGRPIASFQALRHILADAYVRDASGWSTVLYAAAAFDDGADDAPLTASVAKAYVSRGSRKVAHQAIQVFGGIALTAEHPAHRFLRRIAVREQQFGDAAQHEQALGRALARQVAARTPAAASVR